MTPRPRTTRSASIWASASPTRPKPSSAPRTPSTACALRSACRLASPGRAPFFTSAKRYTAAPSRCLSLTRTQCPDNRDATKQGNFICYDGNSGRAINAAKFGTKRKAADEPAAPIKSEAGVSKVDHQQFTIEWMNTHGPMIAALYAHMMDHKPKRTIVEEDASQLPNV